MPFSEKKNYTLCTIILTRILYNKHIFSKPETKIYLLFIINNNLISIINAHGGQDIYNKLKLDHKMNSIQLSQVPRKKNWGGVTYRTTYISIFLDRTFLDNTLSFQSLFIWPIIILLEPRWKVNKIIVVFFFQSLFNFKILLISKSCRWWTDQSN